MAHALYARSADKAHGVLTAARQLEKEVEGLPSLQMSVSNVARDLGEWSEEGEKNERADWRGEDRGAL